MDGKYRDRDRLKVAESCTCQSEEQIIHQDIKNQAKSLGKMSIRFTEGGWLRRRRGPPPLTARDRQ